jgi:hypothetical protein
MYAAAAHRSYSQTVAELLRDLIAVFREDVERARPDIAEADNADIDFLHIYQ